MELLHSSCPELASLRAENKVAMSWIHCDSFCVSNSVLEQLILHVRNWVTSTNSGTHALVQITPFDLTHINVECLQSAELTITCEQTPQNTSWILMGIKSVNNGNYRQMSRSHCQQSCNSSILESNIADWTILCTQETHLNFGNHWAELECWCMVHQGRLASQIQWWHALPNRNITMWWTHKLKQLRNM